MSQQNLLTGGGGGGLEDRAEEYVDEEEEDDDDDQRRPTTPHIPGAPDDPGEDDDDGAREDEESDPDRIEDDDGDDPERPEPEPSVTEEEIREQLEGDLETTVDREIWIDVGVDTDQIERDIADDFDELSAADITVREVNGELEITGDQIQDQEVELDDPDPSQVGRDVAADDPRFDRDDIQDAAVVSDGDQVALRLTPGAAAEMALESEDRFDPEDFEAEAVEGTRAVRLTPTEDTVDEQFQDIWSDMDEDLLESAADEAVYDEDDLIVQDVDGGLAVVPTQEAHEEFIEAALGGDARMGQVDMQDRPVPGDREAGLGGDARKGAVDTTMTDLPEEDAGYDLDQGVDDLIQQTLSRASEEFREREMQEEFGRVGETLARYSPIVVSERIVRGEEGFATDAYTQFGRETAQLADPFAAAAFGTDAARLARSRTQPDPDDVGEYRAPELDDIEGTLIEDWQRSRDVGGTVGTRLAEQARDDPAAFLGTAAALTVGGAVIGTGALRGAQATRRLDLKTRRLLEDDRAMAQPPRRQRPDADEGETIQIQRERPPDADEPTPSEWVEQRTQRPDEDLRAARAAEEPEAQRVDSPDEDYREAIQRESREAADELAAEEPQAQRVDSLDEDYREAIQRESREAADELAAGQPTTDARAAFPDQFPGLSPGLMQPPRPRGPRATVGGRTEAETAIRPGRELDAVAASGFTTSQVAEEGFEYAAMADVEVEEQQEVAVEEEMTVLEEETTTVEDELTAIEDQEAVTEVDTQTTTDEMVQTEAQTEFVAEAQRTETVAETTTVQETATTQTAQTTQAQTATGAQQTAAREGVQSTIGGLAALDTGLGLDVSLGLQQQFVTQFRARTPTGRTTRRVRPRLPDDVGGEVDGFELGFEDDEPVEAVEQDPVEPGWFAETLEGFVEPFGQPEAVDPERDDLGFGLELPTEMLVDPDPDQEEDVEDVLSVFFGGGR